MKKLAILDTDQNTIRNGSLLKGEMVDAAVGDPEELEANAFAGLMLMPSNKIKDQIEMLGIDESRVILDDVLALMDDSVEESQNGQFFTTVLK